MLRIDKKAVKTTIKDKLMDILEAGSSLNIPDIVLDFSQTKLEVPSYFLRACNSKDSRE